MSITQVEGHATTVLAEGTNHTHRAATAPSYRFPFLHSNFIPSKQIRKKQDSKAALPQKKKKKKKPPYWIEYWLLNIKKSRLPGAWGSVGGARGSTQNTMEELCLWIFGKGLTLHSLFWTAFCLGASDSHEFNGISLYLYGSLKVAPSWGVLL